MHRFGLDEDKPACTLIKNSKPWTVIEYPIMDTHRIHPDSTHYATEAEKTQPSCAQFEILLEMDDDAKFCVWVKMLHFTKNFKFQIFDGGKKMLKEPFSFQLPMNYVSNYGNNRWFFPCANVPQKTESGKSFEQKLYNVSQYFEYI